MVDEVAKLPWKWELPWKPADSRETKPRKGKNAPKHKPAVSAGPPQCNVLEYFFCNVVKIAYVQRVFILPPLFALTNATSRLLRTFIFFTKT